MHFICLVKSCGKHMLTKCSTYYGNFLRTHGENMSVYTFNMCLVDAYHILKVLKKSQHMFHMWLTYVLACDYICDNRMLNIYGTICLPYDQHMVITWSAV